MQNGWSICIGMHFVTRSRNDLMHPSGGPLISSGSGIHGGRAMNSAVSRLISRSAQAPKLLTASATLALEARSIALASLRRP